MRITYLGAIHLALEALADAGSRGLPAGDVGFVVYKHRRQAVCSKHGGGDYAAQMLLGRMRKAGWARTQNGEGSSVWEITDAGREALQELDSR